MTRQGPRRATRADGSTPLGSPSGSPHRELPSATTPTVPSYIHQLSQQVDRTTGSGQRRIERDHVLAHKAKSDELGAAAAMVTTVGFQDGAIKYARRQGVALIVLRRFTPEDWEGRVQRFAVEAHIAFPSVTACLKLSPESEDALAEAGIGVPVDVDSAEDVFAGTHFRHLDGSWAGPALDLLEHLGADRTIGSKRITLPEPRIMEWRGVDIELRALTWTVTALPFVHRFTVTGDLSDAVLVCEVVVGGQPYNRAIFRRHLAAYEFTDEGEVVERDRYDAPD